MPRPKSEIIERARVVSQRRDHLVAVIGPCLVVIYLDRVSDATMAETERAQAELLEAHPRCYMLAIIEDGVSIPNDRDRAEIAAHFQRTCRRNDSYAAVIAGKGLWMSAARAALSMLTLVVRPKCGALTTGSVEAAVEFLARRAGDGELDSHALAEEVARLRRTASTMAA